MELDLGIPDWVPGLAQENRKGCLPLGREMEVRMGEDWHCIQ